MTTEGNTNIVTTLEERRTDRGWKVAAIALLITTGVQFGGWVYWFSGWKSTTDSTIKLHETRLGKLETQVDDLPRTLQRMMIQQRLLIEGMNVIIAREGGSPVPIITDPERG